MTSSEKFRIIYSAYKVRDCHVDDACQCIYVRVCALIHVYGSLGGGLRHVIAEVRGSQRRRLEESSRHDAASGIVLLIVHIDFPNI